MSLFYLETEGMGRDNEASDSSEVSLMASWPDAGKHAPFISLASSWACETFVWKRLKMWFDILLIAQAIHPKYGGKLPINAQGSLSDKTSFGAEQHISLCHVSPI